MQQSANTKGLSFFQSQYFDAVFPLFIFIGLVEKPPTPTFQPLPTNTGNLFTFFNTSAMRFSHRRPGLWSILLSKCHKKKQKTSIARKRLTADVSDYFTSTKKQTKLQSGWHCIGEDEEDFRMNPVRAGRFTAAALRRSRTLKLRQPADSHWLDNVSPSFLPPFSLVHHRSLPLLPSVSLQLSLTPSLPTLWLFHPRVSVLHQSAVSRPGLSATQQHQTLPRLSVYLPRQYASRTPSLPLPCIDWRHTDVQEMNICATCTGIMRYTTYLVCVGSASQL